MSAAKIILDTNIVSYLMKGGLLAETYSPHVQGKLLAIAFITVGEMYFGAENNNWGDKRRKDLEMRLRNFVVIPYDHEIARCYGRLTAERKRSGQRIAPNDAWIAACAARHAVPLVTHNAKDFQGITSLEIITAREEGD
jgi:predicted nucleic acid-binding protein